MTMSHVKIIIGSMIVAVLIVGSVVWHRNTEKIARYSVGSEDAHAYAYNPQSVNELLRMDGVAHTVPLEEIVSGGVPKDAIASMDHAQITTIQKIPTWFDRSGMGIVAKVDGFARFYPYQVLAHHEIVNDVMHDTPLLVTYCPLCFTGVIYDSHVNGEVLQFGVSGKLWQSNLIMYNRSNPESLWSQAIGEAIVGTHAGTMLKPLPFDITPFDAFAASYPEGEVVIGDRDHPQAYARIPYGGDLSNPNVSFPTKGDHDVRLPSNAIILGISVDGVDKAYLLESITHITTFEDRVGSRVLDISYDREKEIMVIHDITDGKRTRVQPSPHFWFSWVALHPETEIYQ